MRTSPVHPAVPIVLGLAIMFASGCSSSAQPSRPQPPQLPQVRSMAPGAVGYIDGTDERAKRGDRALIEFKPDNRTVVAPALAEVSPVPTDQRKVRINRLPNGQYEITHLGGTLVGRDHDRTLASDELPVTLRVPQSSVKFEPRF